MLTLLPIPAGLSPAGVMARTLLAEPPAGVTLILVEPPAALRNDRDRLLWEQLSLPRLARRAGADRLVLFSPTLPLLPAPPVTLYPCGAAPSRRGGFFARLRAALSAALPVDTLVWPADLPGAPTLRARQVISAPPRVHPAFLRQPAPEVEPYILYRGDPHDQAAIVFLLSAWRWAGPAIGAICPLVFPFNEIRPPSISRDHLDDDPAQTRPSTGSGNGRSPSLSRGAFDPAHRPESPTFPAAQAYGLTPYGSLQGQASSRDELEDGVEWRPCYTIEELAALTAGAAVVAAPGGALPWGDPVLEAMLVGRPLVSLENEITAARVGPAGYLVPPGDARAFGAALITLAVETEMAAALGAAARERALRRLEEFA